MGWQSPNFTNDLKSGSVMNFVCGYDLELCQEIELSQYQSGQCFLNKSKNSRLAKPFFFNSCKDWETPRCNPSSD